MSQSADGRNTLTVDLEDNGSVLFAQVVTAPSPLTSGGSGELAGSAHGRD